MGKAYKKYDQFDSTERDMYDELFLMARNNGDFYPTDPDGSIMYSFEQYVEQKHREMQEMFNDIQGQLAEELREDWE
jgi:hypothetical protein